MYPTHIKLNIFCDIILKRIIATVSWLMSLRPNNSVNEIVFS